MIIACIRFSIITFTFLCQYLSLSNAFIQYFGSQSSGVPKTPLQNNDNTNRLLLLHLTSVPCNGIDYSFLLSSPSSNVSQNSYTKEDLFTKEQINYITELVNKRSIARNNGNYELADSIREEVNRLATTAVVVENGDVDNITTRQIILPKGYEIFIKDIPLKEGGGSSWRLQSTHKESIEWIEEEEEDDDYNGENINVNNSSKHNNDVDNGSSVLKIAHSALGLASWSSENNISIDQDKLESLVIQAKERLRKTGTRELRGRKAADAAFWFAMAGVKDQIEECHPDHLQFSLFDALTFVCLEELRRFGKRSSCRAMDILHMVERIAAAGIKSEYTDLFQKLAAECLLMKDLSRTGLLENGIIEMLQKGTVELHSERSLLWIWRFSTRQRKQQAFLKSASKHWESSVVNDNHNVHDYDNSSNHTVQWSNIFDDASLPLIVDLGCGMGISVLGLATTSSTDKATSGDNVYLGDIEWSDYNFIGADLSQLAVNFASSVSQRWKCQGRVYFALLSAEEVMKKIIDSYPGQVKLVTIQFPTPFSFQENGLEEGIKDEIFECITNQGNKQLPQSAYSGFMVTKRLLDLVKVALKDGSGKLLLQSNCEDVAVLMKNIAVNEIGFLTLDVEKCTHKLENKASLTKRTEKWISVNGERAEGSYWSSIALLPRRGSTETEIACLLNGTPVHRCILELRDVSDV